MINAKAASRKPVPERYTAIEEDDKNDGTFADISFACKILFAPKKAIIMAKMIMAKRVDINFFI